MSVKPSKPQSGPEGKSLSRRQFLRNGAWVLAGSLMTACTPAPSTTQTPPTAAPPPAAPAATSPTAAPVIAKSARTLIAGNVGDLTNLDPFLMQATNYPMMENVYDQFVRLDNQMEIQPAIIQEWQTSTDGLTVDLKVRQGVKYHDGSSATADDIAQCIMRAANSETGAHQNPSWKIATEATASGNDRVQVKLSQPGAYLYSAMGLISLIRPGAFQDLKSREGGSGPFQVKEWIPGDYLDMVKFPDYWDTGKPIPESVRVKLFQDASAMTAALEAGTIDIALSIPPKDYPRLKDRFNIVRGQDAANFYCMALNTKRPPFDKKEVRQAIAHTFDKATMTTNVLFGISEPIDLAWPKSSFAYFPEFEGMYKYDLDVAKEMLAKAGAEGIEFTIPVPNNYPELGQFGEILKATLTKIGCTVNLEPMDPAQWTPIVQSGDYQALLTFAGGTQWYPTRISLGSFSRTANNTCWPDGIPPKGWIDGLQQADAAMNPEDAKAGMKLAVTTLMDEMWVVPIAFRYSLFGLQKNVSGFANGVYDQPRFMDVTVAA